MNPLLAKILAALLLLGVIALLAMPHLNKEEKVRKEPVTFILTDAKSHAFLNRRDMRAKLEKANIKVKLHEPDGATVEHELRFNDYDAVWLSDGSEEATVSDVLDEAEDAPVQAMGDSNIVSLTARGQELAQTMSADSQIVSFAEGHFGGPAPAEAAPEGEAGAGGPETPSVTDKPAANETTPTETAS